MSVFVRSLTTSHDANHGRIIADRRIRAYANIPIILVEQKPDEPRRGEQSTTLM